MASDGGCEDGKTQVEGEEEEEEFPNLYPLSGDAKFFDKVLTKSNVAPLYQMAVPSKNWPKLPNVEAPVVLIHRGKKWKTAYSGSLRIRKRFDSRWKLFVNDNNLKEGDACRFEIIEASNELVELKVQILRGDLPKSLLAKMKGENSEAPIIVD